ncbi:hypothetical protein [Pseudorhodoplanes sp.]|uniref:hypothetical protein n=1 Tax=Pseudorhodoplanes sp. TaxID=1934341 RepID=UPI002C78F244|nr:hypothetical protein [Pseudorhodoplanes sp.]HWV54742.1 hypothetical protein [Pseudorhodoplanes sp.]
MLHLQQPEVLRVTRYLSIALAFAVVVDTAPASAITLDELKGIGIQARASYNMRIRRAEGDFNTQMTMVLKFKIDDEGRISGENTRTVTTPRGPRSKALPMRARIGTPGQPAAGGDGIWLIDGDKLVVLRAFDAGGFKGEIEFKGAGAAMTCTYRAPFVREEGKGNIRTQSSVVGGPITILSASQTSSDCKVMR